MKKNFVSSNISCNFAASVPAQPLYNAQISGPFYFNDIINENTLF